MINRKLHINEKYFLFLEFFSVLMTLFFFYVLFAFFYSVIFRIGETNDYALCLFALFAFLKVFVEYKKMLSNKFFHKDSNSFKIQKVYKLIKDRIFWFGAFFSVLNTIYAADVVNYLP